MANTRPKVEKRSQHKQNEVNIYYQFGLDPYYAKVYIQTRRMQSEQRKTLLWRCIVSTWSP